MRAVERALAPYRAELQGIVVESTFNWYWLVNGLMESGYRLHLANTTAIQQYSGIKHGDDHSDALFLAEYDRRRWPLDAREGASDEDLSW